MKIVVACLLASLIASVAIADDFEKLAQQFFAASAALDQEYTAGKQNCQRRYGMKNSPERDSAKYDQCLSDFSEQFLKKRCDFYVKWYERSKDAGGLVRLENYPKCKSYHNY